MTNDYLLQWTEWCYARLAGHGQVVGSWLGIYKGMLCCKKVASKAWLLVKFKLVVGYLLE
jgi:hypothetical protein